MIKQLKKYRLLAIVLLVDLLLAAYRPDLSRMSAINAVSFLGEIALILPMILVLMGLFDAWVPRKLVEQNVGPESGAKGVAFSILVGSAAAGPLYAAFPIAQSLRNKGARLANITIFLGTWAAIKIPMILMESRFVGLRFALLRLALTLPGVIAVGFLMERIVPEHSICQDNHIEGA